MLDETDPEPIKTPIDSVNGYEVDEPLYELRTSNSGERNIAVYPSAQCLIDALTPTTAKIVPCIVPNMHGKFPIFEDLSEVFEVSSVVVCDTTNERIMDIQNDAWFLVHMINSIDEIHNSKVASWAMRHNCPEVLKLYDEKTTCYIPSPYSRFMVSAPMLIHRINIDVLKYLLDKLPENTHIGSWFFDIIYNDINYTTWKFFLDEGFIIRDDFEKEFGPISE